MTLQGSYPTLQQRSCQEGPAVSGCGSRRRHRLDEEHVEVAIRCVVVSRHGERGWARALYAIGAEGDERLLRRLLHREIEFLYGSKPIAAGHQHVFQRGAGKYGCRGLFQCSLGGTREGLVESIQ